MRKFMIKVNGNSYEVEVEEIKSSNSTASVVTSAPSAPQKPVAPKVPKKAVAKPAPAGANAIKAEMPGTILDIKVSEGETVKAGQVLLILEAMKMENEILAPADGVISSINVIKGASVKTGDPLVSM
ncbi:biotin/lipoyl-containing protein [Abyssisolibacter fermentans]|uniref:biotin/lipoyl-containing protein n=1 Tax=Abyssisolibacter fermentans TaxID=1766203 RepID=UPI00082F4B4D|nr:biotin/lipoyl-containing protein [Abyssisolibacter fermentans]